MSAIARRLPCALALLLLLPLAAHAQEQVGDVKKFDNWTVECRKAPDDQTYCAAIQRLATKTEGQDKAMPVLRVLVRPGPEGKPGGLLTAPLGVDLQYGIELSVDGSDPLNYQFRHCDQAGCHAPVEFTDEMFAKLKGGTEGKAFFYTLDGRRIGVPFSLIGFTAAYQEVAK
jgi:invasion protein IalB